MPVDPFDEWAKTNVEPTTDSPKPAPPAKKPLRERVAIMMAHGNTGAGWDIGYLEETRNIWRRRADDVIAMVDQERNSDVSRA
jgi:hypothetical protein